VPDDEDKSVPPAPQPEAHDGTITLEGAGDLSAAAGLAQAAAATFEGSSNLSAGVERRSR
jgi:hypothetical protein